MELETKLVLSMNMGILAAVAAIGYGIHVAPWIGQASKKALLAVFPPIFLVAPIWVLCKWDPLRAKMTNFFVAIQCALAFFRWLELLCGTGPRGFDKKLLNFVVYFALPLEVAFDESGNLARAPPGLLRHVCISGVGHALLQLVVQSVARATSFSPFLDDIRRQPIMSLPLWGLPWSLPALYLQVLWVYAFVAQAMIVVRAIPTLLGVATVQPMLGPLWFSTTTREFWGRRWNMLIHRIMKRTYFTPLLKRGYPRLGGLMAFVISGLFHEHLWAVLSCPDQLHDFGAGLATAFFTFQFVVCAIEAVLEKTALGGLAASWPRWLRTVGMTIALLPASAMFFPPMHNLMFQATAVAHTVELVWDSKSTLELEWRTPPIDWVLVALVGVIVLLRRDSTRPSSIGEPKKVQ